MSDLIAKLESASEGSDELSAYVIRHFRAPNGEVVCSPINGKWCVYTSPGRILEMSSRDGWYRREGWGVTESIDAALALAERVLPGWGVNLFNGDPCHGDNRYCKARLWSNDNPPRGTGFDGNSKTLPLAICAALLRATENTQ